MSTILSENYCGFEFVAFVAMKWFYDELVLQIVNELLVNCLSRKCSDLESINMHPMTFYFLKANMQQQIKYCVYYFSMWLFVIHK